MKQFLLLFLCTAVIRFSYAQVGDGITDNRSVLQTMINDAATTHTTLKLPEGRFLISDYLETPSNCSIEGAGRKTVLLLSSGTGSNRSVLRAFSVKSNITIKNLTLNANGAGNTGSNIVAYAVADRVVNLTLENVCFKDAKDYGALQIKGTETGYCSNINITNCRFPYTGRTAIELRGCQNVNITNPYITRWGEQNPASAAVQLQSQQCSNVVITGGTFKNTAGTQFAIESAAANVSNATISNNIFYDSAGLGGNGISGYFTNSTFGFNQHIGGNGNQRSGYELFGSNNIIDHPVVKAGLIAVSAGSVTNVNTNNVQILYPEVTTKGSNSSGILIGAWTGLITSNVTIVGGTVDTRAANGNSSAFTVGCYGIPGIVQNITMKETKLYSSTSAVRIQALPGSKDLLLENVQFMQDTQDINDVTGTMNYTIKNAGASALITWLGRR